jgi:hypothetical protein
MSEFFFSNLKVVHFVIKNKYSKQKINFFFFLLSILINGITYYILLIISFSTLNLKKI